MLGRGLPADRHFPPGFPDRWENFRAIKRSAFEGVGGFDEVGHGEDVTIGRKLGELAVAAPGTVCWHYEPDTLRDIFASARWLGRGERIREGGRRTTLRPWRLIRRAKSLAVENRMPSLFVYRLVWDAGVLFGWFTRNVRPSAK
jgi:GT2 family glycosyltransferase